MDERKNIRLILAAQYTSERGADSAFFQFGAEIDLFKSHAHNMVVKPDSIRTSIDLPLTLHRRLHEVAARRGCSARQLILASIEQAVAQSDPARPQRRLSLDAPLVPARGRKPFNFTNDEIYNLIEFP